MRELPFNRMFAWLLLTAVVFAPNPRESETTSQDQKVPVESLAGRILGPTFDQGLIGEGIRHSLSVLGKRHAPDSWPFLQVTSGSLLLLTAALLAVRHIRKPSLIGWAPLKSRAPPLSV
jgi:hypothetical protein